MSETFGSSPRRRHEFAGVIGADSIDDLARALEDIARELRETGNECVTGGPSWGGHWRHVVAPYQTHEKYFEQVDDYLKRLRREREAAP